MNDILEIMKVKRPLSTPIHPLLYSRWSPRSMTGQAISQDDLTALFEAARMAPSSYNAQPWRLIYVTREAASWNDYINLLVDFNKQWCKNAASLILIVSKKTFDHNGKPSQTHSFDAGAAWMSIALEGVHRGLVVHAMQGFNYDKARVIANVSEEFQVEAMIAVGHKGTKESLPPSMQEQETPNARKPLSDIIFKEHME
jgi:nitroreductase